MEKILIALAMFASVTGVSAQTKKPVQKKAEVKKECSDIKKDCSAKEETDDCCAAPSITKTKTVSPAKKAL